MRRHPALIACAALAAFGLGGMVDSLTTTTTATYSTDHRTTVELVHANDSMQHACHGYSALEMKADGTTEIVGHCR